MNKLKMKKLTIGLQALVFMFAVSVPAQAALLVGTAPTSGSVISLRNYQPITNATTVINPIPTTTSPLPQPGSTPTAPVVSPGSTLTPTGSGTSVVYSLKKFVVPVPTTTQPVTQPSTQPTTQPTAPTPSQPVTQPSTTPSTPAAIPPATALSAAEQYMFNEVNKERAIAGVAPLKVDLRLVGVAQAKANDMKTNGYFSHTSPTYGSPFDMIRLAGVQYRAAGENIARYISADMAMAGLMSSDGHRRNILNPAYTHLGIGVANSSAGNYYVQVFAAE